MHPSRPKIAHDDAKLDVRLHVGYISPPKASIDSEHEAVAPIDVGIQDVLAIPKFRVLMHSNLIGAQIREPIQPGRIYGRCEDALVAEAIVLCHISPVILGHSICSPDWTGGKSYFVCFASCTVNIPIT